MRKLVQLITFSGCFPDSTEESSFSGDELFVKASESNLRFDTFLVGPVETGRSFADVVDGVERAGVGT